MDKKNVAVFFGGRSCEHEISIITGLQLIEYLFILQEMEDGTQVKNY